MKAGTGREQRIGDGIVLGVDGLPQRRGAGGCDPRWRGRLTEVDEDVAQRAVRDEGDDLHFHFVATREWHTDEDLAPRDKSRADAGR